MPTIIIDENRFIKVSRVGACQWAGAWVIAEVSQTLMSLDIRNGRPGEKVLCISRQTWISCQRLFSFFLGGDVLADGNSIYIYLTASLYPNRHSSLLFILLALLLAFSISSIHIRTKNLSILVHPFGVNTVYPSLYNPNCSINYIMINRNINLPDRGRWETRDRLCHPIIIILIRQIPYARKGSHTGNKPNDARRASWYKTCILYVRLR